MKSQIITQAASSYARAPARPGPRADSGPWPPQLRQRRRGRHPQPVAAAGERDGDVRLERLGFSPGEVIGRSLEGWNGKAPEREAGARSQKKKNQKTKVLLLLNIKMMKKSEVDRAILIEDDHIIEWRKKYLRNMQQYRLEGRTIFYCDESAFDTKSQPGKMLVDLTVLSVKDAMEKEYSTGLNWNCGRGFGSVTRSFCCCYG